MLLVVLSVVGAAQAKKGGGGGGGTTTLTETIVPEDSGCSSHEDPPCFTELTTAGGVPLKLREELADAQSGRDNRRRSLTYIAQLTDFQLADEESPARVEFADNDPVPKSAWRPQEGFHPFAIDQSMRRLNGLLTSPIQQGNNQRAKMRMAFLTGDQADNQQYNETLWVRQLVERGSNLNPNSGTLAASELAKCTPPLLPLEQQKLNGLSPEPNYVGVQDYDDFFESHQYYDPDEPVDDWVNWPQYTGLMDRAQQLSFTTAGLNVPTYVVDGNHDGLVQGNEDANNVFEQIATGCRKVRSGPSGSSPGPDPDPNVLLGATTISEPVPPDEDRRFVSKGEVRNVFAAGSQADDHGFKYVDEDQDDATRGTTWYWAWDPNSGKPCNDPSSDGPICYIVIDTISEGGNVQDSSEGNIDHPQFQWLEQKLKDAGCEGPGQPAGCKPKLVMVFGHHPIRSLISETPDENAPPCGGGYDNAQRQYDGADRDPDYDASKQNNNNNAFHNHATNPGCDADTRGSTPLHHGDDVKALLASYSRVIAYVPGHTHENRIMPCGSSECPTGTNGWWELNTSAVADWPQQSRLIDVMDNKDCTLSIFSVVTDHASDIGIPNDGSASGFSGSQLGAIGRTFSFNDPHADLNADGEDKDRNVELLIDDPRCATQQPAGQTAPTETTPTETTPTTPTETTPTETAPTETTSTETTPTETTSEEQPPTGQQTTATGEP